jgi:hypothetical protein
MCLVPLCAAELDLCLECGRVLLLSLWGAVLLCIWRWLLHDRCVLHACPAYALDVCAMGGRGMVRHVWLLNSCVCKVCVALRARFVWHCARVSACALHPEGHVAAPLVPSMSWFDWAVSCRGVVRSCAWRVRAVLAGSWLYLASDSLPCCVCDRLHCTIRGLVCSP